MIMSDALCGSSISYSPLSFITSRTLTTAPPFRTSPEEMAAVWAGRRERGVWSRIAQRQPRQQHITARFIVKANSLISNLEFGYTIPLVWTLHASQRHQQTGISISHLDRSSRRTSFEEKSQAHAYHRQSPPSFSVSSSLLTQALPAPRRLNLSKVLCVCEEEVCVQKEMVFEKENGNARVASTQKEGRKGRRWSCAWRHKNHHNEGTVL